MIFQLKITKCHEKIEIFSLKYLQKKFLPENVYLFLMTKYLDWFEETFVGFKDLLKAPEASMEV